MFVIEPLVLGSISMSFRWMSVRHGVGLKAGRLEHLRVWPKLGITM